MNQWIKPVGGASTDDRTLERSLNSLLDPCVQRHMHQESPFYFQHKPDEIKTLHSDSAQPPEPDFGFRLWADPQQLWAIEAKVLTTDGALAEYLNEVRNNFLKCRYSPLVDGGAMLGYLLKGSPSKFYEKLGKQLDCPLPHHPEFPLRNHKTSDHHRSVPKDRNYAIHFCCHHLILEVGSGLS
jgi:hypothetical protein